MFHIVQQLFEKVEVTKPIASRSSSAEIYIVGLRYKAPGKIDPRLLDVKHLFQSSVVPAKVIIACVYYLSLCFAFIAIKLGESFTSQQCGSDCRLWMFSGNQSKSGIVMGKPRFECLG